MNEEDFLLNDWWSFYDDSAFHRYSHTRYDDEAEEDFSEEDTVTSSERDHHDDMSLSEDEEDRSSAESSEDREPNHRRFFRRHHRPIAIRRPRASAQQETDSTAAGVSSAAQAVTAITEKQKKMQALLSVVLLLVDRIGLRRCLIPAAFVLRPTVVVQKPTETESHPVTVHEEFMGSPDRSNGNALLHFYTIAVVLARKGVRGVLDELSQGFSLTPHEGSAHSSSIGFSFDQNASHVQPLVLVLNVLGCIHGYAIVNPF